MSSVIEIPYTPRPLQEYLHEHPARFKVLVCHRKFGKTVYAINELIKKNFECEHTHPRYAYVAPTLKQAKQIAWDYLKYYTEPIPKVKVHETDLKIDFPNKGRITIYGADNPDAMRGIYLDGVVLDEYAFMHRRVWAQIIRPMLIERKGFAIFIGTPCGRNHFFELFQHFQKKQEEDRLGWLAALYKASDTGILSEEELRGIREDPAISPEEYAQEFECAFLAAIVGAYYGRLIIKAEEEGRITSVPYDPALPVHTSWDIGVDDMTCIWFFQVLPGGEIHAIDYLEGSGEGIEFYLKALNRRKYNYGTDYVPHDFKARSFAAGGRSAFEIAKAAGRKLQLIKATAALDRIQATRTMLPRVWFDAEKTKLGLEGLRHYRSKQDEKKGTLTGPIHDWASHPADAFGTFALSYQERRVVDITGSEDRLPRTITINPTQTSVGWMGV